MYKIISVNNLDTRYPDLTGCCVGFTIWAITQIINGIELTTDRNAVVLTQENRNEIIDLQNKFIATHLEQNQNIKIGQEYVTSIMTALPPNIKTSSPSEFIIYIIITKSNTYHVVLIHDGKDNHTVYSLPTNEPKRHTFNKTENPSDLLRRPEIGAIKRGTRRYYQSFIEVCSSHTTSSKYLSTQKLFTKFLKERTPLLRGPF